MTTGFKSTSARGAGPKAVRAARPARCVPTASGLPCAPHVRGAAPSARVGRVQVGLECAANTTLCVHGDGCHHSDW
eukprot:4205992-Prymnesium_polylepis.1